MRTEMLKDSGTQAEIWEDSETLEELLEYLSDVGLPRVRLFDDGWYAVVEMRTTGAGTNVKISSDFGMSSAREAAKQVVLRVQQAVKDLVRSQAG